MNRKYLIVFIITLMIVCICSISYARPPYETWTCNADEEFVYCQTPYVPVRLIDEVFEYDKDDPTKKIKYTFSSPNDIFMYKDDTLFIADSFNDRILHIKNTGELIKVVGDKEEPGELREPNGVFVDSEGMVYVADTGNERIAVFDKNGKYIKEFKRPESPYLPLDYEFSPLKLVKGKRGYIYVVTKRGYYGLTQLKTDGTYESMYGTNKVELGLIERIRRAFYTKEQLKRSHVVLPGTISNVHLGKDNFLYTCTKKVKEGQVKKFNVAGEDMLDNKEMKVAVWDVGLDKKTSFTDVTVDRNGIISVIAERTGIVHQYDSNGDLLFVFSRKSDQKSQMGVFGYPSSIAVDSNLNLYVSDSRHNYIHVFKPTEFGNLVYNAVSLYNQGKYLKSREPWEEVLRLNSNFYRAHLGIGKSYYKNHKWSKALEEFKMAKSVDEYSDAYLRLRIKWSKKNFSWLATTLTILAFVYLLYGSIRKKIRRGRRKIKAEEGKLNA